MAEVLSASTTAEIAYPDVVFCFNFSYELTEDSQSIGSSSFGQASLLLVSICLHPSPSHEVTVPTMEARFRRISR